MVVKFLEDHPSAVQASTVAQLNMGVAEAVYAEVVGAARDVEVPLDGAMRAWKQGLTLQKRPIKKPGNPAVQAALEARLNSNLAWGLLQMGTRERDHVKRASVFAGEALGHAETEGLTRTLTLVATCYHQSNQAVTAEGLYQSALGAAAVSPLEKLELRDAASSYSKLLSDWDRRERDTEMNKQRATDIDESLPGPWQGKSGIHGSLWFWTPNLFL
jgi:hypothetical protein